MSDSTELFRLGESHPNSRGFQVLAFPDANGQKCTLQQSSAIRECEDLEAVDLPGRSAIWLGCDTAEPKILASHAAEHGIKTEEKEGWVSYPIPDEVLMSTRMHLTRPQVYALVRHLTRWLETGNLDL